MSEAALGEGTQVAGSSADWSTLVMINGAVAQLTPLRKMVDSSSSSISRFFLTYCILELVLESQLPPKIVSLLFTITDSHVKLIVLWGS